MSTIAISYSSLNNASSEAKSVSQKLDRYADSIEKTVYNKLNSYDGDRSSNIRSASNSALSKIRELRESAKDYSNYASDIKSVKDECKRVDKAVRSEVSKLTASFKSANGINNSLFFIDTVYYWKTKIDNSSAASRWRDDIIDQRDAKRDSLFDAIEQWYDYEGGKELIVNGLVALLEIAIGVVSVAAAIMSGGALIVIIAGVVAGVIGIVNGLVNLANERDAYRHTHYGNDPAYGARRSNINSLQDLLRTDTDSKFWHNIATVIDVTNFVCSAISLIDGVSNLVKNGYKWVSGSTKALDDITAKNIFSKGTWKNFKGKMSDSLKNIKTIFKDGLDDLLKGIKQGDFSKFNADIADFTSDFLHNMKAHYLDFSTDQKGLSSAENIGNMVKELLDDGIKISEITEAILPGIGITQLISVEKIDKKIIKIDFEKFGLKDLWKVGKDGISTFGKDGLKGILDNTILERNALTGYQNVLDKLKERTVKGYQNVLNKLKERSVKNVSLSNMYFPKAA